jgi:hypothetical protein
MRAITPSPVVAAFVVLALMGGCADSTAPSPGAPSSDQLAVFPGKAIIGPGQAVQLQASLTDKSGTARQGVTVAWRSSNEAVATVSSSGQVLGRAEGSAVITASAHGLAEFSSIQVLEPRSKTDRQVRPNMDPGRTQ